MVENERYNCFNIWEGFGGCLIGIGAHFGGSFLFVSWGGRKMSKGLKMRCIWLFDGVLREGNALIERKNKGGLMSYYELRWEVGERRCSNTKCARDRAELGRKVGRKQP